MSKSATVIDLELVRQEVRSEKEGAENLYHEFDYLNTNVHISALKKFLDRLDNPRPDDNIELLQKEFEPELYKVLSEWAYRDCKTLRASRREIIDGNMIDYPQEYTGSLGVARKYAEVRDQENKSEFINFCANITSGNGGQWNHNQAEKMAAIALRALMQANDLEEVKVAFKSAVSGYTDACSEQCSKDIVRDGVLIDSGVGVPCAIFDPSELNIENFPELTGEQLGFIKTLYDQGKFMGAVSSVISHELMRDQDNPEMFVPHGSKVSICLKKADDGKVYALSTAHYYRSSDIMNAAINAREPEEEKAINVTMITDITALNGERFIPGCGTGPVTTGIVMSGSKQEINKLSIPKSIQVSPDALDNKLQKDVTKLVPLKNAFIAEAKKEADNNQKSLVAHSMKELERRKFFASSVDDTPEDRLVKYFAMQLKPGTVVGSKHKDQMKEDVIRILNPHVKDDKVKEKALEEVASVMVRDCVAVASSEDSTIKLSFGQKIRHIVSDGLKSLLGLNREKQEFRDIVAGYDFTAALKGSIANNSTTSTPEIPSTQGKVGTLER